MSMKLIGNRNNPNCIYDMQWSNKMDLIALVSETGEVVINRFKWDVPMKIPPPATVDANSASVTSLGWRIDEKILAIAYNNHLINLVDIEDQSKEVIISIKIPSCIKSICWTQNTIDIPEDDKSILEDFKVYLSQLPNINNTVSSSTKKHDYRSTKFYSKSGLNFLIVICEDARIYIYVYGVLSCGSIDVRKSVNADGDEKIDILEAKLSTNFEQLFVLYQKDNLLHYACFENPLMMKYHATLWKLSVKYGLILNIQDYINDTVEHIGEAWELVLLEMDNKLSKYAKKQSEGAISADFLELLLFGYPSEALEQFLTQDMTVRELKKLSNSLEMSYGTIQKLVVKPLYSATIALFHHVNHLYGMHQNTYEYKELLGTATNAALKNTGSFLIKSHELQQIIDKSMRDFKIFFRWLYITISRLMDDSVPEDAGPISQQEVNYLAEFLDNFEQNRVEFKNQDTDEREIRFNLERIGQYLSNKDIMIQAQDDPKNAWSELLSENECLVANKFVYTHRKNTSLIQEQKMMESSISSIFQRLEKSIGSKYQLQFDIVVGNDILCEMPRIITSHAVDGDDENAVNYFTVLLSDCELLFISYYANSEMKIAKIVFGDKDDLDISSLGHLSFIDVKFYNSKIISALLRNEIGTKTQSCFIKLPISRILDDLSENSSTDPAILNMYNFIDESAFKIIEGFSGMLMAVSGSRKVAAFLASNQKIVKLYELEVDEDEIDEDNSNNASFEMELKI
ncbi:hypothetical protein ACKWTF_011019 [Chironomus riparius]